MSKEQTVKREYVTREDRLILAQSYYGWYMFGTARTESERVDEDCAMDNGGVPIFEDQLTDAHKAVLEKHKVPLSISASSALLLYQYQQGAPQVVGHIEKAVQEQSTNLSDEQVDELSRIINMRRADIHYNEYEVEKSWEVISWKVDDDGLRLSDHFVISQHESRTQAEKAMERYVAKLVYADIQLFDLRKNGYIN